MLILLMPAVLVALFLYLLGAKERPSDDLYPWQGEFLIAVAIVGALLVVVTEILSLLTAIHQLSLTLSWSIILIVVIFIGWRKQRFPRAWRRVRVIFHGWGALDTIFLLSMGAIVLLILIIALVAPTNNVDAMQYHVPRALHWAQNKSLQHYPVARLAQNTRPYWAEAGILHLRVLWGNDRPVNLVQWFNMIASVLAAVGIVAIFGGNRWTRWLTAAFVLSIPIGVLQASTSLNDYASAMWVIILAYFVVLSQKRELIRTEFAGLALALGLGMLTKGTFFPYAAPLMVWFFLVRLFRVGMKRVVGEGMVVILIAIAVNLGFWARNFTTYGAPYGTGISVGTVYSVEDTRTLQEPVEPPAESEVDGQVGEERSQIESVHPVPPTKDQRTSLLPLYRGPLNGPVNRVFQMVALNFVTPVNVINQIYFEILQFLGGPFTPGFIGSLQAMVWNHEHLAGNPLHMLLIAAAILYWCIQAIRRRGSLLAQYAIVAAIGFVLVSLISYSAWIYSIRYQLSFLLLGAPLVAYAIEKFNRKVITNIVAVGLLIYALPYLLISNQRPVIGMPPWPTRVGSIFTTEPSELLFALSPGERDEYEEVARQIKNAACSEIGLWLHSEDTEYSIWWLLDAPQSGRVIRHVVGYPDLNTIDPSFAPCAIICTQCQGMEVFHGLPVSSDYGHVQLFLELD